MSLSQSSAVIRRGWLKKSPTRRDGVQQAGRVHDRWFVLFPSFLEYWTGTTGIDKVKGTIDLLPSTEVDTCRSDIPGAAAAAWFYIRNGCVRCRTQALLILPLRGMVADGGVFCLFACSKCMGSESFLGFARVPFVRVWWCCPACVLPQQTHTPCQRLRLTPACATPTATAAPTCT